MLGVRHEKEGKLRVTYAHWDDAKVVLDGQVFRRNGAMRTCRPGLDCPPRAATLLWSGAWSGAEPMCSSSPLEESLWHRLQRFRQCLAIHRAPALLLRGSTAAVGASPCSERSP